MLAGILYFIFLILFAYLPTIKSRFVFYFILIYVYVYSEIPVHNFELSTIIIFNTARVFTKTDILFRPMFLYVIIIWKKLRINSSFSAANIMDQHLQTKLCTRYLNTKQLDKFYA